MSDNFRIKIENPIDTQKIADVKGLALALVKTMDTLNEETVHYLGQRYAHRPATEPVSMDALRTISGRLFQAYRRNEAAINSDGNITSSIGNNMVYAAIHEFGGQTKAHDIVARNAKALAFNPGTGKFFSAQDFMQAIKGTRGNNRKIKTDLFVQENGIIFRRKVHHPGSDIPARAPIQRGIEDRLPEYGKALSKAATDFLNAKN
ncbi:MAG TPA: hypothetical protein VF988_03655 [Verrucomicrobiae bacterium]